MAAAFLPMARRVPLNTPGSPDATTTLVRQHLRAVWRFLRLLGCAPDEADDLTQETFVVALRKGLGDRAPAQVAVFLRRTARHLFLRSRVQRDRRAKILAKAAEETWKRTCADDGGDRHVAAIRTCLGELGARARKVVRLFYEQQRSRAQVAAALDMQETGVKTALQRVRRTLKECVERRLA